MSEKQWYEDVPRDKFEGKHVRAVMDSGAVVEGRLSLWIGDRVAICMVGSDEGITVLFSKDGAFRLTEGVKSLDLVWDEHDWKQIEDQPLRHGDAVVANGRLYKVSAIMPGEYYSQILTDTPLGQCIPMYLVSCALRRKGAIPAASGYYEDKGGLHWVRAAGDKEDKPWRMVEPYAAMIPAMSCDEMLDRVPLTPVHFESGRAA